MAKKKVAVIPGDANSILMNTLSSLGVANLLQFADAAADSEVVCVPTGFPQLDVILHPEKRGWPRGRNIEIFSGHESAGKTSLALNILGNAQRQGLRALLCDIEDTTDKKYLFEQGCDLSSLLFMQAPESGPLPAEVWLETIKKCSDHLDLIVVDSVAALELQGNLEKDTSENDKVAGVPLLMSAFLKKNLAKRAAIIWINQSRSAIGGYAPVGAAPQTKTTGGKALPFYCSIRLQLTEIGKIAGAGGEDAPPAGIKVKVFCKKNKIAPPYRQCILSYVYGFGFSPVWDYMELGLKLGVIEKKSSWLAFRNEKFQGMMNLHNVFVQHDDFFSDLKHAVDGDEALVADNVTEIQA